MKCWWFTDSSVKVSVLFRKRISVAYSLALLLVVIATLSLKHSAQAASATSNTTELSEEGGGKEDGKKAVNVTFLGNLTSFDDVRQQAALYDERNCTDDRWMRRLVGIFQHLLGPHNVHFLFSPEVLSVIGKSISVHIDTVNHFQPSKGEEVLPTWRVALDKWMMTGALLAVETMGDVPRWQKKKNNNKSMEKKKNNNNKSMEKKKNNNNKSMEKKKKKKSMEKEGGFFFGHQGKKKKTTKALLGEQHEHSDLSAVNSQLPSLRYFADSLASLAKKGESLDDGEASPGIDLHLVAALGSILIDCLSIPDFWQYETRITRIIGLGELVLNAAHALKLKTYYTIGGMKEEEEELWVEDSEEAVRRVLAAANTTTRRGGAEAAARNGIPNFLGDFTARYYELLRLSLRQLLAEPEFASQLVTVLEVGLAAGKSGISVQFHSEAAERSPMFQLRNETAVIRSRLSRSLAEVDERFQHYSNITDILMPTSSSPSYEKTFNVHLQTNADGNLSFQSVIRTFNASSLLVQLLDSHLIPKDVFLRTRKQYPAIPKPETNGIGLMWMKQIAASLNRARIGLSAPFAEEVKACLRTSQTTTTTSFWAYSRFVFAPFLGDTHSFFHFAQMDDYSSLTSPNKLKRGRIAWTLPYITYKRFGANFESPNKTRDVLLDDLVARNHTARSLLFWLTYANTLSSHQQPLEFVYNLTTQPLFPPLGLRKEDTRDAWRFFFFAQALGQIVLSNNPQLRPSRLLRHSSTDFDTIAYKPKYPIVANFMVILRSFKRFGDSVAANPKYFYNMTDSGILQPRDSPVFVNETSSSAWLQLQNDSRRMLFPQEEVFQDRHDRLGCIEDAVYKCIAYYECRVLRIMKTMKTSAVWKVDDHPQYDGPYNVYYTANASPEEIRAYQSNTKEEEVGRKKKKTTKTSHDYGTDRYGGYVLAFVKDDLKQWPLSQWSFRNEDGGSATAVSD